MFTFPIGANWRQQNQSTLVDIFGTDLVINYSAKSVVRSVVSGEDRISEWTDRSGNNFHAIQSTSSLCPVYDATGFNGLPVAKMLNSRWMNIPNCLSSSWGQATTLILYNLTSNTNHFTAMTTGSHAGSEAYWSANNVFSFQGYIDEWSTFRRDGFPTSGNTLNITGQAYVEIVSGVGSGNYKIWRNTVLRGTANPSFGVSSSPLIGRSRIGALYVNYMDGDIAEIAIIKRAITEMEATQAREYFKSEWNLTIY